MRKGKRSALGIICVKKMIGLLIALMIACGTLAAKAEVFADYYLSDTELGKQDLSVTFEIVRILGAFDDEVPLNNPQDMFIDRNDLIYIADTGNNRVVVIDSNNNVVDIYDGTYGSENKRFSQPQGIYVDDAGHVFVADTDNGRIVHLDNNGGFIEEFVKPEEETYDNTYAFRPVKIAVDDMGIIYIANNFDYHGLITLDPKNRFLGYIGATRVGFDLKEYLIRMFATNEQKEVLSNKVPPYFSNFYLHNGLIYVTSFWDNENQIKKLSPSGKNIFPAKFYGERNGSNMFSMLPGFVDVTVDGNNILYAADLVTGKIYCYDQEGRNLAVFGGPGRRAGRFEAISALANDSKNNLYVLDKICGTIQIATPTDLMENIIIATVLHEKGEYDQAVGPWTRVLEYDATNLLATEGLARGAYGKGEYEKAMDLYGKAFSKEGYSRAFSEFRLLVYRINFVLVALIVLAIVILAAIALKKLRKTADKAADSMLCSAGNFGFRHIGRTALLIIFHPLDCIEGIKRCREKIRLWNAGILLGLIVFVRVAYIYIVHYPLADVSLIYVDLTQQIALLIMPLLSFVIVSFGITSITDGKQTFIETLYSSFVAFIPYILFTLPVGLLSRLLSGEESGFYSFIQTGLMAWCIILLLAGILILNEYTVRKLVTTLLKSLFGILCLWMILFLFYIIVYQTRSFFQDVFTELSIVLNL